MGVVGASGSNIWEATPQNDKQRDIWDAGPGGKAQQMLESENTKQPLRERFQKNRECLPDTHPSSCKNTNLFFCGFIFTKNVIIRQKRKVFNFLGEFVLGVVSLGSQFAHSFTVVIKQGSLLGSTNVREAKSRTQKRKRLNLAAQKGQN